jgi:hypothetical protein
LYGRFAPCSVIFAVLASDLGVAVGDKLRIQAIEGVDDVVSIAGIFTLGNEAVDKSWLVTSLWHAQSLFALPGGATRLELKVADVFTAGAVAREITSHTGFTADSWMKLNAELLSGLSAQTVLADEPTGNLDSVSAEEVFSLMRRFNRDLGTTFLIVTHDARIANRCDRIIEIADGRIRSDRRL